jgi:hypothetical protein
MEKGHIEGEDNRFQETELTAFFAKNPYLSFVFKKTEKIVSATYLVTDLIRDEDVLKWQLREKILDILSQVSFLCAIGLSDKQSSEKISEKIQCAFMETISLFQLGGFAGMISEMNVSVMKRELLALLKCLENQSHADLGQAVLSADFFQTNDSNDNSHSQPKMKSQVRRTGKLSESNYPALSGIPVFYKGHNKEHNKGQSLIQERNSASFKTKSFSGGQHDQQNNIRRIAILEVLKKEQNIGVNEMKSVIKDCSEKTIQRELLAMVKLGVLKKEGERRWSRYSLA